MADLTTAHATIDHTGITGAGGSVATDAIWDAAGDLAVGSGANTAAKLTKGANGGVLAMGNGAVIWNAGTSFPASKATNDRYFRTDLGHEFRWDGTRWITTQLLPSVGTPRILEDGGSGTGTPQRVMQTTIHSTLDIWAERLDAAFYITTTNNASNYWTLNVKNLAESTTYATLNTSAMSANTWTVGTWTTGAVIPATALGLMWLMEKTGSPLAPTVAATLWYRLIAT